MDLINEVIREILIPHTTTNPKSRCGLLHNHVGELRGGVGEGGEAVRGNFGSGYPSNP
jgi:hypothetical protein